MNGLQARVDRAAEQMEKSGHYVLAAVLDNVSEQLEQQGECAHGTCADGTCADESGKCPDGTAAVADYQLLGSPGAVQASFPKIQQPEREPAAILTDNAGRLFESVKRYGARAYRVDSGGVEVQLDRDGVETTAEFQFCSRDEAGNPQLRLTFRCGDERMVRWASLPRLGGEELVAATTHVFGTGENYGAGVVVASTVTADDDVDPEAYRKEHGKCPKGYHFDGQKCFKSGPGAKKKAEEPGAEPKKAGPKPMTEKEFDAVIDKYDDVDGIEEDDAGNMVGVFDDAESAKKFAADMKAKGHKPTVVDDRGQTRVVMKSGPDLSENEFDKFADQFEGVDGIGGDKDGNLQLEFEDGMEGEAEKALEAIQKKGYKAAVREGRDGPELVVFAPVTAFNRRLVDRIEQDVHDHAGPSGLVLYSGARLREALPHLEAWTARVVRRHLSRK